ncbi:cytidine deaminase-like protein [Pyronema domesticum]|uniref:Deoxycytidylate deaminase n=1 Tax=Pyronema omphalodes (strain CBS 100304) TaxID=1076935 RepID=U4L1P6_PYROM|nr:cytidine deaminase-like protein [Pyronema domesticum]CCX09457.1 Similar to Deoxycytidylate deaminase; acc. no. O43012 [Pyronema omphalodes CBS 100304]
MLVGLCGGLCAGKRSVASFFVEVFDFHEIILDYPSEVKSSEIPEETFPGASADVAAQPNQNVTKFKSIQELMDYVTPRWRERFVLTGIRDRSVVDELSTRPFFLLMSIDAPVSVRWKRYVERRQKNSDPPHTLEEFLYASDSQMYHPISGIAAISDRATIKLINASSSLTVLHRALVYLNITDPERVRPGWDAYFMQLASLAAKRSNCMKRRVGCVLVRQKRVLATGYNGAPRGLTNCNEGGCGRCNSGSAGGTGLSTCLCLHAEENALLEAGRERIGNEAILYCDTCPCLTCSIKIVQVGISEVVYSQGYSMDDQTARVLMEGGVKLRQYSPPRDGLVE